MSEQQVALYVVSIIAAFLLGYAIGRLRDGYTTPRDEDHVSRECLDWINLEKGKRR